MVSANALDDSLEQTGHQSTNLLDLTDFENFLKFSQEKGLLNTVGEWPVFEKSFKERDCENTVFSQEQHGTSEHLLVELGASLDLVQGNNDVSKEDDMLVSEGHSES